MSFLSARSWMLRGLLGLVALLCGGLLATEAARAVSPAFVTTSLSAYPPNVGYGVGGPMMMLAASRDHTLFSPIYTDYEDIDGDGVDDYTFKPTFRYYGYFDSLKCYSYNPSHSTGGRFEPVANVSSTTRYSCPTTGRYWSGNFLNWATMTRIDVVRKMMYGGFRREDSSTDTTLEMAQMSQDAHSFVKYYAGDDVRDFTPFSFATDLASAGLTICNRGTINSDPTTSSPGAPVMRVLKGNFSLWATIPGTVCRWSSELSGFSFGTKATAFYSQYGPNQGRLASDPTAHKPNLPVQSTDGATYTAASTTIGPELQIRVQACRAGWVGSERCQTYGSATSPVLKPVGLLQEFGTTRQTDQPARAEFGLITGSYDSNLRGGALRKNIGSLNDEVDPVSGRFCHRIGGTRPSTCASSGGIIASFDAIRLYDVGSYGRTRPDGYGEWVHPSVITNGNFASWGNPMSEMVVQALSYLAGQSVSDPSSTTRDAAVGFPTGVTRRDPLNDTLTDPVASVSRRTLYGRGICRATNLLAISSGATNYDTDEAGSTEDLYALFDRFASLNGQSGNTLQALTDAVGRNEGINGTSRSVGSASAGFGVDCTAKPIGAGNLVGGVYSPGLSSVAGVCPEAPGIKGTYLGAGAAFFANTRAIREIGGAGGRTTELTDATGRTVLTSRLPAAALRVRTYAASLAGGVARIEVPIPGTSRKVYITPESSWNHGAAEGLIPGAMLTFRSLYSSADSGAYVVTWNDTQFGGDYDMDLVGFIRWKLTPVSGSTGYDLEIFTDVLNHNAGAGGSHGFSIMGADAPPSSEFKADGRYLTHGSNGFRSAGDCSTLSVPATLSQPGFALRCNFTDSGMPRQPSTTATGGSDPDGFGWPSQLRFGTTTRSVGFIEQQRAGTVNLTTTVATKFRVSAGVDAVTLRDPLWYIAKYGSFDTGETTFATSTSALPEARRGTTAVNWDKENNNGQPCASGATCADGEPDGYFLARRPELLESRLRVLLEKIVQNSNALPAVSSAQLINGSYKFVAEFNAQTFNGTIKAYELVNGEFAATPLWDAGRLLTTAATAGTRQIITNQVSSTGVASGMAFTTMAINASAAATAGATPLYKIALGGGDTEALRTRADQLVDYLRGGRSNERVVFRGRDDTNLMGAVVSSSPWLQDAKSAARFTDSDFASGTPSYYAFSVTKASRASLLWVGAQDGMLHSFRATSGAPVLSYVPSPVVAQLSNAFDVRTTTATPLMEGSPFTADVLIGSGTGAAWRTYLYSSLGRGGKGVFALDVTDPSTLTEANAASTFKWVFTAQDDNDLGHVLMDPVRHNASGQAHPVVRLNSGGFGVLVPNGYKSATGRAVLFILDAAGPDSSGWKDSAGVPRAYRKLATAATDTDNGLMGLTWVDLDNNTTADIVYATDLKGRVWKFDIRSSDPAQWKSAFLGTGDVPVPFFSAVDSAGTALPITTSPVVTFPNFGGALVSFGTGRAIEAGDFPRSTTTYRFFTVWDKGRYVGDQVTPAPESATPNPLPGTGTRTLDSTAFLQRLLVRDPSTGLIYLAKRVGTSLVPVPATEAATSFNPSTHDGWFFDFPTGGESVISAPVNRQSFILFTSVRPAEDESQSCSVAPQASVYALSPTSGLPVSGLFSRRTVLGPDGTPIEVNPFGMESADQRVINVRDTSTKTRCDAEGRCTVDEASTCPPGKIKTRRLGASTDALMCAPANQLRIQWREIPGMKTL